MKQFRTKEMSVKLSFTCVSNEYFANNLRDYYVYFSSELCESKVHGFYFKTFYKLHSYSEFVVLGFDTNKYSELPAYICVSKIY